MSNLFIMNAQLNPKGKEAADGVYPGALLLLNEWLEIENFGSQAVVPLSDISVSHKFLDKNRRKTPFRESYWTGEVSQEFLQPMQ